MYRDRWTEIQLTDREIDRQWNEQTDRQTDEKRKGKMTKRQMD